MVIIIMGVSGSGKTTVGLKLGKELGCPFYDSDDFHTEAAKEKMSRGIALTDEDRFPWLRRLADAMKGWERENKQSVLACSALKQKYRDILEKDLPVRWIYLKGTPELIRQRLKERKSHFWNPQLLDSQFAALEEPAGAITLDINQDSDKMVGSLVRQLKEF